MKTQRARARSRIASNILSMTIGQAGNWLLSLIYFVVVARFFGPGPFGQFMLARSIVMVAWILGGLGIDTLITRTVARDADQTRLLASAGIAARFGLSVPLLLGLLALSNLLQLPGTVAVCLLFFALAESLWGAQRILGAVFQGRERMSLNAAVTFVRNLLELGFALGVIAIGARVTALAAMEIPLAMAVLLASLLWMRQFGGLTRHVSAFAIRDLVVRGAAFSVSDAFLAVYLYIDTIILASLAGSAAVGIYAPATKLFSVPMVLLGIAGPVTLPQLSRLGVSKGPEFFSMARRVLLVLVAIGIPVSVVFASMASPIIRLLFGPEFSSSALPLVLLSLTIVPVFMNFEFGQILAAADRQWWWVIALCGCSILNPALNLALIPLAAHDWNNPAAGAALAWLLTELVELVYGFVLLRRVVMEVRFVRLFLLTLIAGALQGLVIVLLGRISLVFSESAGLLVFVAVAWMSGVIPRDEAKVLVEEATRFLQLNRGGQVEYVGVWPDRSRA